MTLSLRRAAIILAVIAAPLCLGPTCAEAKVEPGAVQVQPEAVKTDVLIEAVADVLAKMDVRLGAIETTAGRDVNTPWLMALAIGWPPLCLLAYVLADRFAMLRGVKDGLRGRQPPQAMPVLIVCPKCGEPFKRQ